MKIEDGEWQTKDANQVEYFLLYHMDLDLQNDIKDSVHEFYYHYVYFILFKFSEHPNKLYAILPRVCSISEKVQY